MFWCIINYILFVLKEVLKLAESKYRRTCSYIAIAVLINTLLLQTLSTFVYSLVPLAEQSIFTFARTHGINAGDLYHAYEETLMLTAYLVSFMIPAFIFMFMTRKEGHEPMRLGVKLKPESPLVIIASIGIVLTSAYLNSIMVSFVDFSPLYDTQPLDTPVKVLMSFISIAIVPAVCEEFLYRGCVLSNLLPYGKTTAIIGSALLFALMHGNFAQFFYTFVAGLVLGAVYVETGSIWISTFIHLFNNFYSVIQQVLYEQNDGSEKMEIVIFMIDVMIPVAGLAIGAWLIYKRTKADKIAVGAIPTGKYDLDNKTLVKGFLNPVMIVHIVISLILASFVVLAALMLPMVESIG